MCEHFEGVFKLSKTAKTYTFFIIYTVVNVAVSFLMLHVFDINIIDVFVFNIIGQLAIFIPVIFIGKLMSGESMRDTYSLNKPALMDMLLAAVLAYAIGPVISLLSLIMALIFPNTAADTLIAAGDTSLFISVLTLCVIPAFFEEMIFRGAVFSGFKNLSLKKACIMGGLIFAIAHFDPQRLLYTLVMGALLCYVVYRTKSVFPGMLTHFLLNFSQLMMSLTDTSASEEAAMDIYEAAAQLLGPYILMSLISLPIIIYIVSMMGRKNGRGKPLFSLLPKPKKEFEIEDETVFDYAPQKIYEERIINWQFIVIIIIYVLITAVL